jgi:hypothetical protein
MICPHCGKPIIPNGILPIVEAKSIPPPPIKPTYCPRCTVPPEARLSCRCCYVEGCCSVDTVNTKSPCPGGAICKKTKEGKNVNPNQ